MKREDIEKVCWHILENCMVIIDGGVLYQNEELCAEAESVRLVEDKERLADIVERSIEEFNAMKNGEEKPGVYY